MASISSLGVGSGLDLSSILDSLTAAQKATLTPISNQRTVGAKFSGKRRLLI